MTVRNSGVLREVVLGHVTQGWLRARAARKFYIDYSGADGNRTPSSNVSLMMPALTIHGWGAVTPVGLTAPQTCAAIRAKVSGFREL